MRPPVSARTDHGSINFRIGPLKANSSVANSSNHGTSGLKPALPSQIKSPAPIAPPITPITANGTNSRQCDLTSLQYAATVARLDGVIATALVALASSAFSPQAIIAAKDRKVPPPATEFTTPARKPPPATIRKSVKLTMDPKSPARERPVCP